MTTARPPELRIHVDGLVVDNFAGGGGASLGIEWAIGRSPDIAVNHDPEAIAMHKANHPTTKHLCENVWAVDPKKVCKGQSVALAWFSPDCTFFSKSRGAKPFRERDKAKRRRGLAWVVVRWAKAVRPRVICLENVEEFQDWGPLDDDGKPDKFRKGFTFRRWWAQLEGCGYRVDMRELRASDYGAPTSRRRLFIIARCDGRPIVWPAATHGPGLEPHRTAAECIDWAIPCPSIFERSRPLADNTLRRIARGIRRYVIDARRPFIVPVKTWGGGGNEPASIDAPLRTVTASKRGEHAVVEPFLARLGQWGGNGAYVNGARQPVTTVTTKQEHLLVEPYLVEYHDARRGGDDRTKPVDAPLPTQDTANRFGLVEPFVVPFTHAGDARTLGPSEPMPIITGAHRSEHALIEPYLVRTAHGEKDVTGKRRGKGEHAVDGPLPTVLASNDYALAAPTLIQSGWGEREGQAPRCLDIQKPLGVVPGQGCKHAVVEAFLAKHYGGHETPGSQIDLPIDTITARDHNALVTSHLCKLYGTCPDGQEVTRPAPTIRAMGTHIAEVRAFLISYYGTDQNPQLGLPMPTLTSKHRIGIVQVDGLDYVIADIGMRMLAPRELFRAQGFPDSYVVDSGPGGEPLTKTSQVRMCGNSVCPPIAAALVRANLTAEAVMPDEKREVR